jgi:EAL domain-containing protein (putative c-di-GMP-specific phosphodiesterase class I)
MHSIKTKITAMTVCVIVIAMVIATVFGVTAIRDIKADVLKIDMSFLHEIKDRERSRIILKSVISMADSLGMDVITEGVETEQQLLSLSAMGCNHFQGYFFSRPIPVDEFEMKYSSVD